VPELIDEQVLPIRGFGTFELDMVGVGERLVAGDQLVLMVYGNQQGFVATSSRDLTTAIVTVSGTVSVPMLGDLPRVGD
jgi:ABC-2 type transport system ATP-binding protein